MSELIKTDKIFYPLVHYSEGTESYPPGTRAECIAMAEYIATHGVWNSERQRFYPPNTIVFVEVKEIIP